MTGGKMRIGTAAAILRNDIAARAAYQASCDARGVKPNWSDSGYQAQADRWRQIVAAAADPQPPRAREKMPKKAVRVVASDLHDIAIPMSQAILVLARLFEIPDTDLSRFVGNVKHLQRNGFPKGLHTGRGSPAVLARDQLLQLAVGETLHRAGMMPIPAMAITEEAWELLLPEFNQILGSDISVPRLMAVMANGSVERTIRVIDVGEAMHLVERDDVLSVTLHRLDVLALRLKEAVALIAMTNDHGT